MLSVGQDAHTKPCRLYNTPAEEEEANEVKNQCTKVIVDAYSVNRL